MDTNLEPLTFYSIFVTYLRDLLVYLWGAVALEHAVGCCPHADRVGFIRQPARAAFFKACLRNVGQCVELKDDA